MVNREFRLGAARLLWLAVGVASVLGCEPVFSDRNSEVLGRRVLAVQSSPAQAKPGAEVKLSALVVEPSGAVSVAGYLHRRADLPAGRTVAVISGGNLDPALLAKLVSG